MSMETSQRIVDFDEVESLMDGWIKSGKGPLVIWTHERLGIFADGLFTLHDQEGVSLTDSLIFCRKRGITPCTGQFVADAIRAGWSKEKANEALDSAYSDAGIIPPRKQ